MLDNFEKDNIDDDVDHHIFVTRSKNRDVDSKDYNQHDSVRDQCEARTHAMLPSRPTFSPRSAYANTLPLGYQKFPNFSHMPNILSCPSATIRHAQQPEYPARNGRRHVDGDNTLEINGA
jgi:hypothetical protein